MDDKIFFGIFVYLMLSIIVSATLPDSVYNGSTPTQLDPNLEDDGDLGVVTKVARFLFAGWTIDGIPAILGSLISIINVAALVVGGVYIYDKVRGI